MDWILISEIAYIIIVVLVCLRIIYETRTTTKTLAYMLLAVFVPVIGMIFYFFFGTNYRKRKLYNKKEIHDEILLKEFRENSVRFSDKILQKGDPVVQTNRELAYLLIKDLNSPPMRKNKVKLLLNGENKFPDVLEALRQAKHHIHIEYYIVELGEVTRQIEEILLQKAKEGVEIRVLYDDFGSRSIRKGMTKRLRDAGVKMYPFYKIWFILFANRLNYRNHRKIIIIDGHTAFTGGINISDRYVNNKPDKLYWRDTHLRIDGPGVYYLQYLFIADWNFCSDEKLQPGHFLADSSENDNGDDVIVQIAASGPDSDQPSILFSLLQAVYLAQEEILITTPYYIPGDSMQEALIVAALSGLKVKLLVPGISDSLFVNTAASSYYDELLQAGVEIYRYQKGFVHAKTLVADGKLSVVGSANMDYRSFELNFEVNAVIYDQPFSQQLRNVFYEDIKDAVKIDPVEWSKRSVSTQLAEKIARLLSPLL
jgi:cardiolipin synthase